MSTPSFQESLTALRTQLLEVHRALIASERVVYERSAGTIPSATAFLQLLTTDPWFEWLRPLSTLIAVVDEALADKKTPLTGEAAAAFLAEARLLLTPDEHGDGFPRNYFEVIQRDPDVLIAHRGLSRVLVAGR